MHTQIRLPALLSSLLLASALACGGSDQTSGPTEVDPATVTTGADTKMVITSLQPPAFGTGYSIDLNGDGKLDNQMGALLSSIGNFANGTGGINAQITNGNALLLLDVKSDDSTLTDDATVAMTIESAAKQSSPDLSGTGTFTVDSSIHGGTVGGVLSAGVFEANDPVTTKKPVSATLRMPFSGATLTFKVNGLHMKFQKTCGGSPPPAYCGELHGSVKADEFKAQFYPAVAGLLTAQVAAAPTSTTAAGIEAAFDVGGCSDNGVAATANDGTITGCEVAQNAVVANELQPDVQIFDSSGAYAPQATPTAKDSLSLGFYFEAAKASF